MRRLVLIIFVLSGAAGLVYEVVWARQLVLVFGNTTQAVSAILTGFFGGMAIGSFVRRPDRRPGALAAAPVRRPRAHPRRGRPASRRSRSGSSTRSTAASIRRSSGTPGARAPPVRALAARPGARRRSSWARPCRRSPATSPTPRPERGLRAAVRGEHDRGDPRDRGCRASSSSSCSACPARSSSGAACSGIAGLLALVLDREPRSVAPRAAARCRRRRRSSGPPSGAADPARRPSAGAHARLRSGLTSLGYQVLWTRLLASGTGQLRPTSSR